MLLSTCSPENMGSVGARTTVGLCLGERVVILSVNNRIDMGIYQPLRLNLAALPSHQFRLAMSDRANPATVSSMLA